MDEDISFLGWIVSSFDPLTRLLPDDWKPLALAMRHVREEVALEEKRVLKQLNPLEHEIYSYMSLIKREVERGGSTMPLFTFLTLTKRCARARIRYAALTDVHNKLVDVKDRLLSSSSRHFIFDSNFRQARLATRQHGLYTAADYKEMSRLLNHWRTQQKVIDDALENSLDQMSTEEAIQKEVTSLSVELGLPVKEGEGEEEEEERPSSTTAEYLQRAMMPSG